MSSEGNETSDTQELLTPEEPDENLLDLSPEPNVVGFDETFGPADSISNYSPVVPNVTFDGHDDAPIYATISNAGVSEEEDCLLAPDERELKMGNSCRRWTIVTAFFGTILLVAGILVVGFFDTLVDSIIDKELIIKNGTSFYDTWSNPPVVPHLKIYFWNVSNPEDVKFGAKPKLKEVGPYTFREHWQKVNISFHNNGTVGYATNKTFFFEEKLSVGKQSDNITTLNIPLMVGADVAMKTSHFMEVLYNSLIVTMGEDIFTTRNVSDFVWGYKSKILETAKQFMPDKVPSEYFGFFYKKNGSTGGIYSVFTGEKGFENYSIIDTFNSSRELKFWSSDECNAINGTDGTSYPPNISKSDRLFFFNENLCRSLPLVFNNTVEHFGIEGYRFIPPSNVFGYVEDNPENECFCNGGPPCMGGGLFNISACQFDSPTVISWPHFYQADQIYLDAVEGLHPDPMKHSLFVDVNPKIGAPISAQARVQINIKTVKSKFINILQNMTENVFPVIWFEDGVESLPKDLIQLLHWSTVIPMEMKISFIVTFFAIGGILLVASLVGTAVYSRQMSSKLAISSSSSITPVYHINSSPIRGNSPYESEDEKGHSNPAFSTRNPDE